MGVPGGQGGSCRGAEGNDVLRFEHCGDVAPSARPRAVLRGIAGLQGQAAWAAMVLAVALVGISCPTQPDCPTVLPLEVTWLGGPGADWCWLSRAADAPVRWRWPGRVPHVAGLDTVPQGPSVTKSSSEFSAGNVTKP